MIKSDIDLSLPYMTAQLPGIGGRLRATPDHFVVEEIPLYEPEDDGQHLYVRLTKVGQTTNAVQQQLADLFGISKGDVGFAGMKDKYARTTQTFSLSLGHLDEDGVTQAIARIRDHLAVTVHWGRRHKNKLKLGHLLGNRFAIRVTEMDVPLSVAQERVTAIMDRLRSDGLPNFYGPQRFGHQGASAQRGLAILRGKSYTQDRWLRRFLVSSYQSYLCNRYLARRVEIGSFHHLLEGDVAKKYDTGGMFDVTNLDAEEPRYLAHEISFTAPLFGPKMWEAKGAAGALEAAILAESDTTMAQLRRAKVEGTRRLGRLLLPESEVALDEATNSIVISFALPKGAFATTVLRELMKIELFDMEETDGDS